jgi:iron(III) transport system permease protein
MVMPGVVLAVGMLWLYISIPGLQLLYATVWLTLIGLVVVVMPVASRAVRGALAQIARELEEAASVSGASEWRVLIDIVLRLISRSFLSGWLLAGVIAAGTLDVPLMLLPATTPNVAVLAYTSIFAAMPTQASALLVLLLLAIFAVALLYAAGGMALRFVQIGHRER